MEALELQAEFHDAPLFLEQVGPAYLADWLERRGYRRTSSPPDRNWIRDCRIRPTRTRRPLGEAHVPDYWATTDAGEVHHRSIDSMMESVLHACIPELPPASISVAAYREEAGDRTTGATHARLLPDTTQQIDVDAWIRRHFPDRPCPDRARPLLGTVHEGDTGDLTVWRYNTPIDAWSRIESASGHVEPERLNEAEADTEIRPIAYVYDDGGVASFAAPDTMGSTARMLLLAQGSSARELFA